MNRIVDIATFAAAVVLGAAIGTAIFVGADGLAKLLPPL